MNDSRVYYPRAAINLGFVGRKDASENLMRLEGVEPLNAEATSNAPATAGTWSASIDATLFPVDPAALKAVVCGIHVGDTGGLDKALSTVDGSHRVMLGHADEIEVDIPLDGRPKVNLKGRDYSGLLLDATFLSIGVERLQLGRPVDEIVREVLDASPAFSRLGLVFADTRLRAAPTVPKGTGKKGEEYVFKADDKVWDGLQSLAGLVGMVVNVRDDQVVIQPPRSLAPTVEERMPVFIDGRNMKDLRITSPLGRPDLPNVKVRAVDPATLRRVEGTYPSPPNKVTKVTRSKGGKVTRDDSVEYRLFNVRHPKPTPEVLGEIARRIFDSYAQRQVRLRFTCEDLLAPSQRYGTAISREGELPWDFTLSRLRNGAPVRIHIDRGVREVLEKAVTPAQRETELRRQNFKREVAAGLSQAWHEIDREFICEVVTHRFDQEAGYSLSVEAVDFIEV